MFSVLSKVEDMLVIGLEEEDAGDRERRRRVVGEDEYQFLMSVAVSK